MLVSTMMTRHDDENHVDGPFEMATWDVSRAHFYCEASASWPDFAEACTERVMQRQSGETTWSDVLKESSMKVGTACPAFLCSCYGDLKGLCHGDDFCVVARQKQLQAFGKSP